MTYVPSARLPVLSPGCPARAIANWRPRRWSEFIGAANAAAVESMRSQSLARSFSLPVLVEAPHGLGSSTLMRLALQTVCCERCSEQGDPCQACDGCREQGPRFNGNWHRFTHWEFGGPRLKRKTLLALFRRAEGTERAAIFLDGLDQIRDRRAYEALTSFLNDFAGILLATTDSTQQGVLPPPLRERFRRLSLAPPSEHELVDFLTGRLSDWQLVGRREDVSRVVQLSDRRFRACLHNLAQVAESPNRALTPEAFATIFGLRYTLAPTLPTRRTQ